MSEAATNTTPSPDVVSQDMIERARNCAKEHTDDWDIDWAEILRAALTPAHDDGLVEELEKLLEECNRLTPLSLEHECACDELAHFVLIRQQDILTALRASNHTALLREARNLLQNGEGGYCMCGESTETHGLYSGHAPVDAFDYMADRLVSRIDQALAKDSVKGTGDE